MTRIQESRETPEEATETPRTVSLTVHANTLDSFPNRNINRAYIQEHGIDEFVMKYKMRVGHVRCKEDYVRESTVDPEDPEDSDPVE